jgi:hypothetical protein
MKKITATVEQISAALQAWDQRAAEDPEHFDEWDAAVVDDPMVLGEFFTELLVEAGAVESS